MKRWIEAVGTVNGTGRDLGYDEAVAAAHSIARGEATDAQIGALFAVLGRKGEAAQELLAFSDAFRKYTVPFTSFSDSLTVSSGCDSRQTFVAALPVALLLASVGFPQVLNGKDPLYERKEGSVTMKELLEELGIVPETDARSWERQFRACNVNFLWSDRVCPPLAELRRVRTEIGFATVMDTVERLFNPVHSLHLMVGVERKSAMQMYVSLLEKSGLHKACIVQGIEGSEDVPLHKTSVNRTVTAWGDETGVIDPATLGFSGAELEPIGKAEQLRLLQRILNGDESPDIQKERDHVIFNAGLRFVWFDKVGSYEEGFQLARQLYQRREGLKVVRRWKELSRVKEEQELKRKAN